MMTATITYTDGLTLPIRNLSEEANGCCGGYGCRPGHRAMSDAGRRVTDRLDHGVLPLVDDGILLRSLPNPLSSAELGRLRDARPAGPPRVPALEPRRG